MITTIYKWISTNDSALIATFIIFSLCNMILSLWLDNMSWMLISVFFAITLFISITFYDNSDIDK